MSSIILDTSEQRISHIYTGSSSKWNLQVKMLLILKKYIRIEQKKWLGMTPRPYSYVKVNEQNDIRFDKWMFCEFKMHAKIHVIDSFEQF